MDALDQLDRPITLPPPRRVADGTQTDLGAAPPRAKSTLPPPIPTRAAGKTVPPPIPGRARGTTLPPPIPVSAKATPAEPARARSKTVPPPIPVAALKRGTSTGMLAAPADDVPIDPVIAPPSKELPSTISVAADIDVPITHDEEPHQALPPLPRPSDGWLAAAPAPRALADEWVMPGARTETSAVSDLFSPVPAPASSRAFAPIPTPAAVAPSAPRELTAPPEPSAPLELSEASALFLRTNDPEVETSASDVDMFASPPADEPATNYFERPSYNKRHLVAVGATAVVLAIVAAVIVRGAMKPSAKPAEPPIVAAPAAPAPAPVAAAEAAAPPVAAAEPIAPAPVAGHIDVPVTSDPAGAVVTLIENGTPRIVGKTPMFASVDPAQAYDVVVAAAGYPAAMQHLDPKVTKQIAVSFTSPAAAPAIAARAPAAPAPVAMPGHSAPRATSSHSATSSHRAPPSMALAQVDFGSAQKAPTHHQHQARVAAANPAPHAAKPVSGAHGTLMVASKPPCELVIDGKRTRLETPQRSIELAPGAHSVTFINAKEHVNKTVMISVLANQPTKLARDFTH